MHKYIHICVCVYVYVFQVVLVVKSPTASAGDIRDAGLIPGSGRSLEGWNGNPLQYSGLGNPMDRGAWRAIVHRAAKNWTWLKQLSTCMHTHTHTRTHTQRWWHSGKESVCQYRICQKCRSDPWVGKSPWNRKWQPTPVFLPGNFRGQRSLAGYSPQGFKESGTTEATEPTHADM